VRHRRIVVKPIEYNKRRMRRDYAKIRATVCARVYDCFPAIFFRSATVTSRIFIDTIKRTCTRIWALRYEHDWEEWRLRSTRVTLKNFIASFTIFYMIGDRWISLVLFQINSFLCLSITLISVKSAKCFSILIWNLNPLEITRKFVIGKIFRHKTGIILVIRQKT